VQHHERLASSSHCSFCHRAGKRLRDWSAAMAEFRKWRVDFEPNEAGLVEKRRVADPPGYAPSAGRELVRA